MKNEDQQLTRSIFCTVFAQRTLSPLLNSFTLMVLLHFYCCFPHCMLLEEILQTLISASIPSELHRKSLFWVVNALCTNNCFSLWSKDKFFHSKVTFLSLEVVKQCCFRNHSIILFAEITAQRRNVIWA